MGASAVGPNCTVLVQTLAFMWAPDGADHSGKCLSRKRLRQSVALARLLLLLRGMKRLTVDGLRTVLPDLDELRPLADQLLADSRPDPARTWTVSGTLGSLGDRLVETDGLENELSALADAEHRHRQRIFELVGQAVVLLEDGTASRAAAALLEAAALEEGRDRAEKAEAYADAASRVARDGDDAGVLSLALRRRGRHRRTLGRYGDAARDYEEAALVAESVHDVRGRAEALIGRGNVLEEQGQWEAAADGYREALATLEALEDPSPELWHAQLNLHVVLRSVGALDEALPPLRTAQEIARAIGDDGAEPFLANARGQLDMALGDFEAAEEHLRRALEACLGRGVGSRAEITIRLNLAETLLARGRILDAAEAARRAERRAIVARMPQKLPEVYRLLGRIAAADGVADAFVLFERALEIIEERRLPALERAQTLQAYAESEARTGDPDAAADLMARADGIYDELGIEHRRRPWVDRFDGGSETDPAETNHKEENDG